MRTLKLVALVALPALWQCGYATDSDDGNAHGCSVNYSSAWQSWGGSLYVNHNDPRQCPQNMNPGTQVTAGATIKENGAQFPNSTASSVEVKAFDGYAFNIWQGQDILGDAYFTFTWANNYTYQAETWVSYQAGQSPDFVEFRLNLKQCCNHPIAVMTINFYGTGM